MDRPIIAACERSSDTDGVPMYEFRMRVSPAHYTRISYQDFKIFLLTDFMPQVRAGLDALNVPPEDEK